MSNFFSYDIQYLFPEIFLGISIVTFLILAVFYIADSSKGIIFIINILLKLSILVLILLVFLLIYQLGYSSIFILNFRFFINNYVVFMKFILVIFLLSFFLMSIDFFKYDTIKSYEFILLLLLSLLGMFFMLNSNDFMLLYLALELQTICFYVLASFKTYKNSSTEAGLKYFVLGSFSSGLLLFGMSLVYGFSGTTNFQDLKILLSETDINIELILLGFLFFLVGLFFKLGAAPFHVWLPDIYEGSPLIVTAFFAIITKIPILVVFINLLMNIFYIFINYWHIVVLITSILSLFIGGFGALYQNKIKRLIAYSSISHMGFLLLGISSGIIQGVQAISIYIIIYLILTLNIFAIMFGLKKYNFQKFQNLSDFKSIFKSNPVVALSLCLNLFSYAGIPPLAGFFGKFYILTITTSNYMYITVLIAIFFSTVSTIYYVRLIKIIFFEKLEAWSLYDSFSVGASFILGYTTIVNIFLFYYMTPLLLLIQNLVYKFFY